MNAQYDEGFARALIAGGLVTPEQLERARAVSGSDDAELVETVVAEGYAERGAVMSAMSAHLGLPYEDLDVSSIDPQAVKRVPAAVSIENRLIPVSLSDRTITLAVSGPLSMEAQEEISFASGCSLRAFLCDRPDVDAALAIFFPGQFTAEEIDIEAGAEKLECLSVSEGTGISEECEELDLDEEHVVRLVEKLLADAIRRRASDIHIEPKMEHSLVRYRIDGLLGRVQEMNREVHKAVISRVKILSELDIAERRQPQDGVIFVKFGRRDVDFRVATSPTIYGESVTLSVLDQSRAGADLESLGFDADDMAKIMKALSEPYGFVLSTGPTGSGKTTTMYSMLNKIDSVTRKVVTIEDPVEYRMENLNQIQVNHEIGLGFAPLLRSVLRQDPNVILLGEIRDSETADVAVRAALTGHLLLSTLHTTDAPEVLLRLMEIGIEYYYVREVVKLVVAQRLARRLCVVCREQYVPSDAELGEMGLDAGPDVSLFRAAGCEECRGTGYLDRIGIFEVMPVTEEIRDLMVPGVQLDDITDVAVRQGMQTLWQNGVQKVAAGVTSLEEIRRTLPR